MRKSKLTPKVLKKLTEALENGNFIKPSCEYADISESTYHSWCERAKNEINRYNKALEADPNTKILASEKKYVEFLESVEHAACIAEVSAVQLIHHASIRNWRAAIAFLARRYPERWGRASLGSNNSDETKDFSKAFSQALKELEEDDLVNQTPPIH